MNSLERLLALLEGDSYDVVPCIPFVFGYCAHLEGISLKQYLQNGNSLAYCQLSAQKKVRL